MPPKPSSQRSSGSASTSRSAMSTSAIWPPSDAKRRSPISAASTCRASSAGSSGASAHVYFLIGFRNRIAVTLDWVWSYLTFERGARLITGDIVEAPGPKRRKREAA